MVPIIITLPYTFLAYAKSSMYFFKRLYFHLLLYSGKLQINTYYLQLVNFHLRSSKLFVKVLFVDLLQLWSDHDTTNQKNLVIVQVFCYYIFVVNLLN